MPTDQVFPIIETLRLILRKPSEQDAKALFEVTHDEEVMQYYGMAPFDSDAAALEEIDWFNRLFIQSEGIRWVMTVNGENAYIGDIGFHNWVHRHSRAEIGFKLAKAFWHQGIMTEALERVVDYGFTVMLLNRIEAVVDPHNRACLTLLERAGFVQEGLLREYEHEPKGFVDLIILSLLQGDRRNNAGSH